MFSSIVNALSGNESTGQKQVLQGEKDKPLKRKPVVREKVKHRHVQEVQPVVNREVQQTEIQQIIQPIEDTREDTIHHDEGTLPEQVQVTKAASEVEEAKYQEQKEALPAHERVEEVVGDTEVIHKEPIVRETVKKRYVQEIQPVIERTVEETHVHHVTAPVTEHHVQAPIIKDTVVAPKVSMSDFHENLDVE